MNPINRILPIITFFVFTSLFGQREVFPCSRIDPRPIAIDPITNDTTDILSIYLDGDGSGNGGRGCWVHYDSGTKNYVVTPHSWERTPNGSRQGLIDDALKAMQRSRVEYRNFGTLNNDLYYLLDDGPDPGYGGFAYWLVGNSCWMNTQVSSISGEFGDARRHGFAHEVGHCFVMENVPGLKNYYALNAWFDESVSEYLASEAYKEINVEHDNAKEFDIDGMPFTQEYAAYPLWYYYALKNGKASVVPLMNALTNRSTRFSRLEYLRSIGFDQLFQEFLFELFQLTIQDSGGGGHIPTEAPVVPINQYELDPSQSSIDLPGLAPGRLQYFKLIIPSGFKVTLTPPEGSDLNVFQSYTDDRGGEKKLWETSVVIEGDCSYSIVSNILISHLNSTTIQGLTLNYEMEAKTDCCSGAGEGFDGCLVGTWEMDIDTVNDLIDYEVSGTFTVTIDNEPAGHMNAEFQLRYDYDNGNYDIHKGTASACIVPQGKDGHLNRMALSGVSLGPGNIHQHYNTRRGTTTDQTEDILRMLNGFNYTTCTSEELIVMYMIPMRRVR